MVEYLRWTTFVLAVAAGGSGLAFAADLTKATADAEARKRAAENGARAIRAKAPQNADQARGLYDEAASANNAWLEATKAAIDTGEPDAAVTETATRAASSLLRWLAVRNQALGEAVPTGRPAEAAEASTRQGLIDIATELARKQRRANATRKAEAAADVSSRLRWTPWAEL